MSINYSKLKRFIETSFDDAKEKNRSIKQKDKREDFVYKDIISDFLDMKGKDLKKAFEKKEVEDVEKAMDKVERWLNEQEEKFEHEIEQEKKAAEMKAREEAKGGMKDHFMEALVATMSEDRKSVNDGDELKEALEKVLRDKSSVGGIMTKINAAFDKIYDSYVKNYKEYKDDKGNQKIKKNLKDHAAKIANKILDKNMEFDRMNASTWEVMPVKIDSKIKSTAQGLSDWSNIEKKLATCSLNPQHGSSIQTNTAYHAHAEKGSKGVAFYYKHEEGYEVTPWLYDVATNRNDNNDYYWERGGKSGGPSSKTP